MAIMRPAVNENDSYVQKVIKYIPAEIVTGYTVLVGYLSVGANNEIPANYKTYYLIMLLILISITPIWTYFAVLDNESTSDDIVKRKKHACFHAAIATCAFIIWAYAIGNILLKAVLCHCTRTDCQDCIWYSPVLGSIILVLFTILTPLMERIILGTKLPG